MVHRTPLPFPPFNLIGRALASESGQLCLLDCTSLASPGLVFSVARDVYEGAYPSATRGRSSTRPSVISSPIDSRRENDVDHLAYLREVYIRRGFSGRVADILLQSWWGNTHVAYNSAWAKWCRWCSTRQINPFSAPLEEIMQFLVDQFDCPS